MVPINTNRAVEVASSAAGAGEAAPGLLTAAGARRAALWLADDARLRGDWTGGGDAPAIPDSPSPLGAGTTSTSSVSTRAGEASTFDRKSAPTVTAAMTCAQTDTKSATPAPLVQRDERRAGRDLRGGGGTREICSTDLRLHVMSGTIS